jgi:hypothetical protein
VLARPLRFLARGFAGAVLVLVLAFAVDVLTVLRPPPADCREPLVVNDVTQLNPVKVSEDYLPYPLHATASQFRRAYPRFDEFVALKRRLDPTNKFCNAVWDKYYPR